jgi:hypothetical protein
VTAYAEKAAKTFGIAEDRSVVFEKAMAKGDVKRAGKAGR